MAMLLGLLFRHIARGPPLVLALQKLPRLLSKRLLIGRALVLAVWPHGLLVLVIVLLSGSVEILIPAVTTTPLAFLQVDTKEEVPRTE